MKHSELIEVITRQTGKEPTQREIAEVLKLTRNAISSRAFRDKEYSYDEVMKLASHYGVSLYSPDEYVSALAGGYSNKVVNKKKETIDLPYYEDVYASCGAGQIVYSESTSKIAVSRSNFMDFSPLKNYSVINATGDSMSPTIEDKDKLIVENADNLEIVDNSIYVFSFRNKIYVKRLVHNINEIVVISDNPDKQTYSTQHIQGDDMDGVRLIGKIVGLMRVV